MDRDEAIETRFRHGNCYAMAFALAKRLGWSLEALVVDLPRRCHVVHAWVVDPLGNPFDAGGYFDREGLKEQFLENSGRQWRNDRIETFGAAEDFLVRLEESAADADLWKWYIEKFRRDLAAADEAAESYVIPRYLSEAPALVLA